MPRSLKVTGRHGLAAIAVAALLALTGLATTPSVAAAATVPDLAGTIVYIHASDVWIATPDGRQRRRLTHDGTAAHPYAWPSEDDHGHIVAIRGNSLVTLDQSGRVLHDYAQPLSNTGTLLYASVSPDGKTVAYSMFVTSNICDPVGCGPESLDVLEYLDTASGRLTSAYPSPSYVVSASWVTDRRTVLDSEESEIQLQDPGSDPRLWYRDCTYSRPELCPSSTDSELWHAFPAVSRQGDRYASIVFDQGLASSSRYLTFLNLMDTSGFATGSTPQAPTMRCTLQGLDSSIQGPGVQPGLVELSLQTPTWSPSGRSLAFGLRGADGSWQVVRADIGADLAAGCDPDSWSGGIILSDASMPRWSPAPLAQVISTAPPGTTPRPHLAKTRTTLKASARRLAHRHRLTLKARVRPRSATGRVRFFDGKHRLATVRVAHGKAVWRTRRLRVGVHRLRAKLLKTAKHAASSSAKVRVVVRR